MYRSVGMGNWMTDLMAGRLQLPPMRVELDMPGGVVISQVQNAAAAAPAVRSSGISGAAAWGIPLVAVIAGAMFLNAHRSGGR